MRTDLCVPFSESSVVKALGAKWDMSKKVWFVPDGVDLFPFLKWIIDAPQISKPVMKALKKGR